MGGAHVLPFPHYEEICMGVIKLDNGQVICQTTGLIAVLVPSGKTAPTIWKAVTECQCGECGRDIKIDEMLTVRGNLMSRKQPIKLACRNCRQFKTIGFHRS
jgi:hypothetical protein